LETSIIKNRGISLVEVVLAITVFAIFSTSIFYLSMDTLQSSERIEEGNEAMFYAQEGLEAARQMRDRNYLLLENGDHGLQLASDVWSFIPAPEDVDGFYSRTVSIDDVYRDASGNIAETGTLDPDTKKLLRLFHGHTME
jgi:type II secretory pathway pseudopilin PulG